MVTPACTSRRVAEYSAILWLAAALILPTGCRKPPGSAATTIADPVGYHLRVVGAAPSIEALREYAAIVERRVTGPLFPCVRVSAVDARTLLLEVERSAANSPDAEDSLRRMFVRAPALEFRILAAPDGEGAQRCEHYRTQLQEAGPGLKPGDDAGWFKIHAPLVFFNLRSVKELSGFDPRRSSTCVAEKYQGDYYLLTELAEERGLLRTAVPAWHPQRAVQGRDKRGSTCIDLTLDEVGGGLLAQLTEHNPSRRLCILVDDLAILAPTIRATIREQVQITGAFSEEQWLWLYERLLEASQPFQLEFAGKANATQP